MRYVQSLKRWRCFRGAYVRNWKTGGQEPENTEEDRKGAAKAMGTNDPTEGIQNQIKLKTQTPPEQKKTAAKAIAFSGKSERVVKSKFYKTSKDIGGQSARPPRPRRRLLLLLLPRAACFTPPPPAPPCLLDPPRPSRPAPESQSRRACRRTLEPVAASFAAPSVAGYRGNHRHCPRRRHR